MHVLWLGVVWGGLVPALAGAQPSWQAGAPAETRLALFKAIKTANYPTAETLSQGDFHYEISHRFSRPLTRAIRPISVLMGRPISAPRLATASATG